MIAATLLLAAVSATASPVPQPTPTPFGTFATGGFLRAYDFQRINASGTDQHAFNFGGGLHGEFTVSSRPLTLGATYYFLDPFGLNGPNPKSNPQLDNTLPAYGFGSLGELFAQYRTFTTFFQLGKMQLNTPWANAADGRMIPVTYQGAQARWYFAPGWDVGVASIARFKSRTSATFDANDLLTRTRTPGFLLADVTRSYGPFRATLSQYWFYDIASLTYLEARITAARTSFALQGDTESSMGRALAGPVHNHTIGAKASVRFGMVTATAGYDRAYGAIASPYTNGYVADPLFTTSIIGSLADQRVSGNALKGTLAYTNADGRLSMQIARTGFTFATESDADVTYLLSRIDSTRAYAGFSIRQRWGYRETAGPPYRFLYSRTQLQYVF